MHALREIRKRKGLSLRALAVRARVSPATLSDIERHGYVPGPETRRRIARALGVREEEIWNGMERADTFWRDADLAGIARGVRPVEQPDELAAAILDDAEADALLAEIRRRRRA